MTRALYLCGVFAFTASLGACGDGGTDTAAADTAATDTAATDPANSDAASSDPATSDAADVGPSNTAEGTITFAIFDWMTAEPLEGTTLCSSLADVECVTTDAEGLASITGTFTSGELVQLRGDSDGYFPFLVESVVPEVITFSDEAVTWVMADDSIVEQLVGSLAADVDDTKGHVSMFVNTLTAIGEVVPLLGATVTMDSDAEVGPSYLNALSNFASGVYAAEPGVTSGGVVQFFNVAPGMATISIDGDYTCTTGFSGELVSDQSVAITVEAGRVSYTSLICTPNVVSTVEGTLNLEIVDAITSQPVGGVTLCSSFEELDCVTTDSSGLASVSGDFTLGELAELRGDAEGYFPFYVESVVSEGIDLSGTPYTWAMMEQSLMSQLVGSFGGTTDSSKGQLSVNVFTEDLTPLAGPEVVLEGTAGFGPGYANPVEDFANGLFAQEPGLTDLGVAGFFNVEPGRVAVTVEGHECGVLLSGTMNAAGMTTVNVEAGRVSYLAIFCVAQDTSSP